MKSKDDLSRKDQETGQDITWQSLVKEGYSMLPNMGINTRMRLKQYRSFLRKYWKLSGRPIWNLIYSPTKGDFYQRIFSLFSKGEDRSRPCP